MIDRESISTAIREIVASELRSQHGLQKQACADCGYSDRGLRKWFSGTIVPAYDVVLALLEWLGYDVMSCIRSKTRPGSALHSYLNQGAVSALIMAGTYDQAEIDALKALDRLGLLKGKTMEDAAGLHTRLRAFAGLPAQPVLTPKSEAAGAIAKSKAQGGQRKD